MPLLQRQVLQLPASFLPHSQHFTGYPANLPSGQPLLDHRLPRQPPPDHHQPLPCVLDVEPSDYASVALAQAQFSQSASELQALDRSGDLRKYTVHSADGSRVQYSRIGAITRHSDRKEERKTLMGDVETLKPTVRCLEGEVRELQGIMQGTKAELQESKAELQEIKAELQEIKAELRDMQTTMIDWQVATNLIDGYSEMLWNDLPEDQKDALGEMHIYDMTTLRSCYFEFWKRSTNRNRAANNAFSCIAPEGQEMLAELHRARRSMGHQQMFMAHPEVSVSQCRRFIQLTLVNRSKLIPSVLTELESLEVWSEDGNIRLFSDDGSS